jgi:hypothetical protein
MSTIQVTKDFNEFFNVLCKIEDEKNSWVNEEYADEIVEQKWQQYVIDQKKKKYKSNLKNKDYMKTRELDLRRRLLHRVGKYELEEGEVFE